MLVGWDFVLLGRAKVPVSGFAVSEIQSPKVPSMPSTPRMPSFGAELFRHPKTAFMSFTSCAVNCSSRY